MKKLTWFYCRHSEVAETLPCHGVRVKMADLEQAVLETIRAQMCPALGIDSSKDKLNLQTVQQAEHEEKLRFIQDSKRQLYEQYALGEIDLKTYQERNSEILNPVPSRMITSSRYFLYTASCSIKANRFSSCFGVSAAFRSLSSSMTVSRAKLKGFLRIQSSSIAV